MSAYPGTDAALSRWTRFRGRVVPLILLLSLFSLLFSGTLTVLHARFLAGMMREAGDVDAAAKAVVAHLLIAALLMLLHATYLVVMSHHLVYRQPVSEISGVATLVYPLIAVAYAAYALHSYA